MLNLVFLRNFLDKRNENEICLPQLKNETDIILGHN